MPRKGRLLNTRCTWERGRIVINHTRVWYAHTHTYTCTSAQGNVHKAQLGCSEAICIATIQCVKVCALSLSLSLFCRLCVCMSVCVCARAFAIFLTACVQATSRSSLNSHCRVSSAGRHTLVEAWIYLRTRSRPTRITTNPCKQKAQAHTHTHTHKHGGTHA